LEICRRRASPPAPLRYTPELELRYWPVPICAIRSATVADPASGPLLVTSCTLQTYLTAVPERFSPGCAMPMRSERPQPPRQPSMPTVRQGPKPSDQSLSYGDHSTQCHGGCSLHLRHNRLKSITYHALKAAGCGPQMETAHLIPGSLIRPGDVYVPVGDNRMAVAYDVTVVSPVV
jgi:hypothetical protein